MTTLAVFVGLDDHQAFVQMCVLDASETLLMNRKCGTSAAAAIESCYGAEDLAEELVSAGVVGSCDLRSQAEAESRQDGLERRSAVGGLVASGILAEGLAGSVESATTAACGSSSSAVGSFASLGEQGCWVANQLLDEIEHLQSRIIQVESRLAALTQEDAFVAKLLTMRGLVW